MNKSEHSWNRLHLGTTMFTAACVLTLSATTWGVLNGCFDISGPVPQACVFAPPPTTLCPYWPIINQDAPTVASTSSGLDNFANIQRQCVYRSWSFWHYTESGAIVCGAPFIDYPGFFQPSSIPVGSTCPAGPNPPGGQN